MPNDLPMLEWAGTSYAMANAHPSVRDLADHLAPGNDEDGVAVVLADLFGRCVGRLPPCSEPSALPQRCCSRAWAWSSR